MEKTSEPKIITLIPCLYCDSSDLAESSSDESSDMEDVPCVEIKSQEITKNKVFDEDNIEEGFDTHSVSTRAGSNDSILNAKYLSDITFSSNDFALNSLLSLLPEKLYPG